IATSTSPARGGATSMSMTSSRPAWPASYRTAACDFIEIPTYIARSQNGRCRFILCTAVAEDKHMRIVLLPSIAAAMLLPFVSGCFGPSPSRGGGQVRPDAPRAVRLGDILLTQGYRIE